MPDEGTAKSFEAATGPPLSPPPPVIVINGCPRSGTSLLQRLLATRFNAAVLPETHFIPLFAPYTFLWGNLTTCSGRRSLLRAIYAFTELRITGTRTAVEAMRPYTLLATAPSADRLARDTRTYPDLVSALFQEYRDIHHGSIVVEKTAYFTPFPWDRLADAIPGARFIHIVRDGRDVALSWMRTWFGPKSWPLAAWLWARHVEFGLDWEQRHPERTLRVKYEDFTKDTTSTLQEIGALLGMTPSEQNGQQSSLEWFSFIAKHKHMSKVAAGVEVDNVGKWRPHVAGEDITLFEAIAGRALQRTGYDLAASDSRSLTPTRVRREILLRRGGALFSRVGIKRRLVRVLPPVLWVADKARVPLARVLRKWT